MISLAIAPAVSAYPGKNKTTLSPEPHFLNGRRPFSFVCREKIQPAPGSNEILCLGGVHQIEL